MNIVFFGSDNFAVPSLEALLKSRHKVCCVVTQPDRKKGRGLRLGPTIIKEVALKYDKKIYQPVSVNTPQAADFLKGPDPELFVVIAYGQILSRAILEIPKTFCINAHASLLPKYRGAAPVNWAIINGEKTSGVTIIKMSDKMDTGEIIAQEESGISAEDSVITLEQSLSALAAELLLESVDKIESKSYTLTPQDEAEATYAAKLKKSDALIDWGKSAGSIYNLIRGCLGWPGAYTYCQGKILKVNKAAVLSRAPESLPGTVLEVSRGGIAVAAQDTVLVIEELQLEGKRNMKAGDFISGHKIAVGERLGGKRCRN